jgi:predicted TPR repeat methyltransferase
MVRTLQSAPAKTSSATPTPRKWGVRASATAEVRRANIDAVFGLAVELHRSGELGEAAPVYQCVLAADPDHPDALHLYGVLLHQTGRDDQALTMLARAARVKRFDAGFHRHLGETFRALSRFTEAVHSFEQALALEPDDVASLCNLGHTYAQSGRFEEAETCYRRAATIAPNDAEAHLFHGVSLLRLSRIDEAREALLRSVSLDPTNDEARHMLAAAGGAPASSAPRGYVVTLFDRYAESFETELVVKLHYDVPKRLREAVDRAADAECAGWRIVDLGCGTGLCGLEFRDRAGELIGVDLSPRMIEQAGGQRIYDELIEDDLTAALTHERGPLDLITAGDVFIYVGDLEHVFERSAEVLRDGGLLAFSTERCDGDGFTLRPSGRFAHGESYIRTLAARFGFEVVICVDVDVRIELGEPIEGQIFVLRRCA